MRRITVITDKSIIANNKQQWKHILEHVIPLPKNAPTRTVILPLLPSMGHTFVLWGLRLSWVTFPYKWPARSEAMEKSLLYLPLKFLHGEWVLLFTGGYSHVSQLWWS